MMRENRFEGDRRRPRAVVAEDSLLEAVGPARVVEEAAEVGELGGVDAHAHLQVTRYMHMHMRNGTWLVQQHVHVHVASDTLHVKNWVAPMRNAHRVLAVGDDVHQPAHLLLVVPVSYKLQVTSDKLQVTSYKLRATSYTLKVKSYKRGRLRLVQQQVGDLRAPAPTSSYNVTNSYQRQSYKGTKLHSAPAPTSS